MKMGVMNEENVKEKVKEIFLGEVDYLGKKGEAYREVHPNHWEFVIKVGNERYTLITY